MALTNCPNCGKQISDKAEKCIHCGLFLTPTVISNENDGKISSTIVKKRDSTAYGITIVIVIISILGVGILILWKIGAIDSLLPEDKLSALKSKGNSQNQGNKSTFYNANEKNDHKPTKTIDQTALKIASHTYTWYEDGATASLSFDYDDDPSVGTMTMTGSIHTLEFTFESDRTAMDAVVKPDQICTFTYKYKISGTQINATFVKSTCNYDAKNRMLSYDASRNYISAYTSQGEMKFKP